MSTQSKAGVAIVGAIVIAGVAWLAFGYFGIQAAFTNSEVNEGGPVFASGAGDEASSSEQATGDGDGTSSGELMSAPADEAGADSGEQAEAGEVVRLASGQFSGSTGHDVVGEATVLTDGSTQRFLRLQDFESTNGPDLNVYLRADDGEFIDLGPLKGNIGDQNYEIPADADLDRFNTVQIWCVRFSVLFGDAVVA